jgi:hypothetical protein
MMEHLKENLTKKQMLICGGELFHVRCGAQVLNLIVQDGLSVMKGSIDNIRDSVKYVKSSQSREELFEDSSSASSVRRNLHLTLSHDGTRHTL